MRKNQKRNIRNQKSEKKERMQNKYASSVKRVGKDWYVRNCDMIHVGQKYEERQDTK